MNFSLPARTAVATRARIAATVCRDRWAAPQTLSALRLIASHFDAAADACHTAPFDFTNVVRPIAEAHTLMEAHPDARLPAAVLTYILNPFSPSPLPEPDPLLPVSARLAAEDETLRAELARLNADTRAAEEDTERWFSAVLAALAKWSRLSREVDVDNRRPDNRRAVFAKHVSCPECSGHDVRFSVREWATCACGHGDLWGRFLVCFCLGYDCPAVNAPATTTA